MFSATPVIECPKNLILSIKLYLVPPMLRPLHLMLCYQFELVLLIQSLVRIYMLIYTVIYIIEPRGQGLKKNEIAFLKCCFENWN